MIETLQTFVLAILLAALFVGYVWLFAFVWREIAKLMTLISVYRSGKRFFKEIERFRRDFSK